MPTKVYTKRLLPIAKVHIVSLLGNYCTYRITIYIYIDICFYETLSTLINVISSKSVSKHAKDLCRYEAKRPNLKLKNLAEQLLSYLPSNIPLPS